MEALWGWRIPVRANEKSARANYRWVKGQQHCTLADMSFESCFQLSGPRSHVHAALKHCLAYPHRILDGREHRRLFVSCHKSQANDHDDDADDDGDHDDDADDDDADDDGGGGGGGGGDGTKAASPQPTCVDENEPLGEVRLLATPYGASVPQAQPSDTAATTAGASKADSKEAVISVWIWAHPSIAQQVSASLTAAAQSSASRQHSEGGVVCVTDVSEELCRFRLLGHGAHALLARTLAPAAMEAANDRSSGGEVQPTHSGASKGNRDEAGDACKALPHDVREAIVAHSDADTWAALAAMQSPSHMCRGAALCLSVWDPRLRTPAVTKPPQSVTDGKGRDSDGGDGGNGVSAPQVGSSLACVRACVRACQKVWALATTAVTQTHTQTHTCTHSHTTNQQKLSLSVFLREWLWTGMPGVCDNENTFATVAASRANSLKCLQAPPTHHRPAPHTPGCV